jgi:hypothetical protein
MNEIEETEKRAAIKAPKEAEFYVLMPAVIPPSYRIAVLLSDSEQFEAWLIWMARLRGVSFWIEGKLARWPHNFNNDNDRWHAVALLAHLCKISPVPSKPIMTEIYTSRKAASAALR